ncbi:MAG: ubiquitin-like small modifier protein 1 [Caulobacteraceae bacterium]
MIVKFFASIREYAGVRETTAGPCTDIRQLLQVLCSRYGTRFRGMVFQNGELSKDVIIMLNGRHIEHIKGLDTELREDDVISIFPRVAGG